MNFQRDDISKFFFWRASLRGMKGFEWNYEQLKEALYWHFKKTGRRIFIETEILLISKKALKGFNSFQKWAFFFTLNQDDYLIDFVRNNKQFFKLTEDFISDFDDKYDKENPERL